MFVSLRLYNHLAVSLLTAVSLIVSLPQELGRFLNVYIESGSRPCQFWSELFVHRFMGAVNCSIEY